MPQLKPRLQNSGFQLKLGIFSIPGASYNSAPFKQGCPIMANNASSNSKVPGWVWLFTGTILGAFIMFLMRLSELQPHSEDNRRARLDSPASESEPRQQPRYDFYKLLKDSEVPVTAARPSEVPPKAADNSQYLLQVASFRTASDAEQVRAELLLLNLNARVESAKVDGGSTWHRVIVGPFDSRSQMAKAQSTLYDNRYAPMLLKRKKAG